MPWPHTLTDEEKQRGTEVRATRVRKSRYWYAQRLMDIAEGKIECKPVQLSALKTFADLKGWHGPKSRRNVISRENLEKLAKARQKPEISDDLMTRMAILVKSAESDEDKREQLRKEQA